jgi:hypothetical protein
MTHPTRSRRPLGLLAALLALGCGGKPEAMTDPTAADTAKDVAEMLKEFTEVYKRGPAGLVELADATASHPVGHAAVLSRRYTVAWRVPVSAAGAGSVLAHPTDAAAEGGVVVMQDGSVKQMTADEFKAAPKAK